MIAAIIVSYNFLDSLRAVVYSLGACGLVSNIVIVENGNDEPTANFIQTLEEEAGVSVVRRGNLGWVKGINIGVEQCSEEYLLLLNDDHILTPATIEKMVRELENGHMAVGVEKAKIDPLHNLGMIAKGEDWEYLSGSGLMIRHADFDELGHLDEQFEFGYGEDIDLSFRVKSVGGTLSFVPMSSNDYHFSDHKKMRETLDFDLSKAIHWNHRLLRGRWWRMGHLDEQCRWDNPKPLLNGCLRVNPRHFLAEQVSYGMGMALHGEAILSAMQKLGVELDRHSPLALSYVPCASFVRDQWYPRREYLFTMVEQEEMAVNQVDGIMDADVIFTPSDYNVGVFRSHGFEGPIHKIPLGIDHSVFNLGDKQLGWAGFVPFCFLWLGAASQRKGWDLAIPAFYRLFGPESAGRVELYIKTTLSHSDDVPGIKKIEKNITLDTRNLSSVELAELYRSAHALIFPSRGEGWGQSVIEAMACGCLVIAPKYTALAEFVNEENTLVLDGGKTNAFIGTKAITSDTPLPESVLEQMAKAYRHFNRLLPKIRVGIKTAKKFSWERTAKEIIDIMKMDMELEREGLERERRCCWYEHCTGEI